MTNDRIAIENLCQQLCKVAEKIISITAGMAVLEETNPDLIETYDHFLLDEVAHVQVIGLEMTRIVTEEEGEEDKESNAGESAFGPGELDSVIGEKEEDAPCMAGTGGDE